MSTTTVLLTGASGFIALHITDLLLKKGYKVIGTVRSQAQIDNLLPKFKKLYPNGDLSYEIVTDIVDAHAFEPIFKAHPDITKVLHTASPFSFGLNKDLKEAYYTPAVEGTKNILSATKKFAPQVDTFVLTSSFASIYDHAKALKGEVHTEETWNPVEWEHVDNEGIAYFASKKLAERAAWDFIKEETPNFKLTTVTPPYVFGPQLFDDALAKKNLNTSADYTRAALDTPSDDTSFHSEPAGLAVDVHDVAKLHVAPLEKDLGGLRLFPSAGPFSGQSILDIIHKNFPELNGKVGKGDPTNSEKFLRENTPRTDTSKTLKILGIDKWIPVEESVVSATKQILDYRSKN